MFIVNILQRSALADTLMLNTSPSIRKIKTTSATKLCFEPLLIGEAVQCLLNNGLIRQTKENYKVEN